MEYRQTSAEEYTKYHNRAYEIIAKVATFTKKDYEDLKYTDIINYFEAHYNIIFMFFGQKENRSVIYPNLVKKHRYKSVDDEFWMNCSGMTVPSKEDRYVVFINQEATIKPRAIFTILHELSHIYCHMQDKDSRHLFTSLSSNQLTGEYPEQIQPFEDEANVIASILFLTDEALAQYIDMRAPFNMIATESGMSDQALHNRIMEYLCYSLELQPQYALSWTLGYREHGYPREFSNKLDHDIRSRISFQGMI